MKKTFVLLTIIASLFFFNLSTAIAASIHDGAIVIHSDTFEPGDDTSFRVIFGSPDIIDGKLVFSGGESVINGSQLYEQVQYPLNSQYDIFNISYDVQFFGLPWGNYPDEFVTLLDSPWAKRLELNGDGSMNLEVPYLDKTYLGNVNGLGELHIDLIANMVKEKVEISINGNQYSAAFPLDLDDNQDWSGVRLHQGTSINSGNLFTTIDNVIISGKTAVPIPSTGLLASIGFFGLIGLRRRSLR